MTLIEQKEEWGKLGKQVKFFGQPVDGMDAQQLLIVLGCLAQELKATRERALSYLDFYRFQQSVTALRLDIP